MKLKKMGLTLGLASLALGGVAFVTSTGTTGAVKADAAGETSYYLVGNFTDPSTGASQGWVTDNISDGVKFTFDEADDRFELTLDMKVNNEFRFVSVTDGILTWISAWGDAFYNPFGNHADWFAPIDSKKGDTNFKCLLDGRYTFTLNKGVDSYGSKIYALGVEESTEEVAKYDVTYMNGDTVLKTVEVSEGFYTPEFILVEGYQLKGWYRDADLTDLITGSVEVNGDIAIYGKYEVSPADYYVYFISGDSTPVTYAYTYSSHGSQFNVAWPGEEMENTGISWGDGKTLYRFKIETDFDCDKIIFNNGKEGDAKLETPSMDLMGRSWIYDFPAPNLDLMQAWTDEFASEDQYAALEFILNWKSNVRKNHLWGDPETEWLNSVCWLIEDDAAWNDLKASYEALGKAQALVDPIEDALYGEKMYTIGETYDYLAAAHASDALAAGAPTILGENGNDLTIAIASIVGAMLLGVGAYFFLRKKKEAPCA